VRWQARARAERAGRKRDTALDSFDRFAGRLSKAASPSAPRPLPPHFYEKCGIRQGFFFPVFHLSICVSSAVEGGRLCWNVFPTGNRLTNFYPFRLEAIT
jgi:hypothetical protein